MDLEGCTVFAEVDNMLMTTLMYKIYPDVVYAINDKSSKIIEIFRSLREKNGNSIKYIDDDVYSAVEQHVDIKQGDSNFFIGDETTDYILDVLLSCYIDNTNDAHFFKRFDTESTIFYVYNEIEIPDGLKGKVYVHEKGKMQAVLQKEWDKGERGTLC